MKIKDNYQRTLINEILTSPFLYQLAPKTRAILQLNPCETKKIRQKMVGTNLKALTMKLMEERTTLEAEMNALIETLCQPGGPGLTGNLVDSEAGFFYFLRFFNSFSYTNS